MIRQSKITHRRTAMSSASVFTKGVLESIVSWAEIFTFVFTFIGAFSGVAYLVFNKPLKKIEAQERRDADQKFEELRARNNELEKTIAPRILGIKGLPSGK